MKINQKGQGRSFWIIVTMIIALVVVVLVILGILSVFYFHNFTGPLFSLERYVDKIRTGDLTMEINIRRNDELNDLANKLGEMVGNLRKMVSQDRKRAESISHSLEEIITAQGKKLSQEQIQELETLQQEASHITKDFNIL